MEDSMDRVFAQALATIRALSNPKIIPASPVIQRPPIQDRIHLYGLYKQATEGDVDLLMARPTGNRGEDESGRTKWDAWYSQRGLTKAEAKRRYIPYLLETMDKYASSTAEARELILELRGLWDQVKYLQANTDSQPASPIEQSARATKHTTRFEDLQYEKVADNPEEEDDVTEEEEQDRVSISKRDAISALDEIVTKVTLLKSLLMASSDNTLSSYRHSMFITAPSTPSHSLSRLPSALGLSKLSSLRKQLPEASSGSEDSDGSWKTFFFLLIKKMLLFSRRIAFDVALVAAIVTLIRWRRSMQRAIASSSTSSTIAR
ncbi:acyl CoA binding protein-domain-containing protein [Kockiozyma suomiensis]|uniref:acyl CoA binding protein-domain-containing protein n=1 Tax=Kockiozyma suomiensis TaxID=1337062 RepID=UPI0033431221